LAPSSRWLLLGCMAVLLIQIFFGTEVRGAIDRVAASVPRENWVSRLGMDFIIHRSFSWIVLVLNGLFFLQIRKTIAHKTLSLTLFLLILCSLATGMVMAYFNVPAFVQPIHLLAATVAFGIQLMLYLDMRRKPITE
jgi:cytochrome c oxidase assembly protein subunit 15